jgi:hypothetical protein
LVYKQDYGGWLMANKLQSAFLNMFKARECIQLVFTTSQLAMNAFPLGYECSIRHEGGA